MIHSIIRTTGAIVLYLTVLNFPIYLDYAATTPCDESVVKAMLPYFNQHFGNASSTVHTYGWEAQAAVDTARNAVADLIHAESTEIVFTSGATEACNLALRGVFERYAAKGNHIITTKTEHKAVLSTCQALEKKGAEITYLDVLENGMIDLELLKKSIRPETVLIAIQYANNETGVLMPIAAIGMIAKENNILFFTDATQAVGKVPVDVLQDHIDLMAFSSHKLYGPKGVGALYVRRKNPRVKLMPQITGGGQEREIRSGTTNVPGVVGFGKACALCKEAMADDADRIKILRENLENELLQIEGSYRNGDKQFRLPHIANISFRYVNSSQVLTAVHKNIALSSGSACTSGSLDPSYVLTAMGIEEPLARAAIRFSLGRYTTDEEIEYTISAVKNSIEKLRMENPQWPLHQQHT